MPREYLPILLQTVVAILFGAVALLFSVLLGKRGRRNPTKDMPYECGVPPIGSQQPRFSVKFYLIALLFLLFDLEVVFLYPWAATYRAFIAANGTAILWSMVSFLTIATIGYLYAIKKGVLDWRK